MKKSIFLFSTLLLSCFVSTAQTTYYYKLTKKKVNGVISENVSGGQFITINKNVCYESDNQGFSVNHGRMDYKNTENGLLCFYGASYYGDNTMLLFKSDYSSFNIKTMDGDVYVYKRVTPPAGVTTCSLIRKPTPTTTPSSQPYIPSVPVTTYPVTTYPQTTTSSSSSTSTSTSRPTTTTPVKRVCNRCHGTGRQEKNDGTCFGLGNKYCNECNQTVPCSHYHTTCQLCYGKGYL